MSPDFEYTYFHKEIFLAYETRPKTLPIQLCFPEILFSSKTSDICASNDKLVKQFGSLWISLLFFVSCLVIHVPDSCRQEIWGGIIKWGISNAWSTSFALDTKRNRNMPFQNLSDPESFIPHFWVSYLLNIFCPIHFFLLCPEG